ncbi:MAG TPA: MoaD/ThiS family protein, partial [Thermoanaerobaculia bacterium]|nr:MoaD/ThiS family protein [Thermoanaerobaculia bacterium]
MNVRLLYFAVLRDLAGRSEEWLDLPPGSRASDVWNMLRERHRALAGYRQAPMTALNESYAGA